MTISFETHIKLLDKPPNGSLFWVSKSVNTSIPDAYRSVQWPSGFTLRQIVRGRGYLRVRGEEYALETGVLFGCFPGVEVDFGSPQGWDWRECQFEGEGAMDAMIACGCSAQSPVCVPASPKACERLLTDLHQEMASEAINAHRCLSFVHALAALVSPAPSHELSYRDPKRLVSLMLQLLVTESQTPWDVATLAQSLGVHRTTLMRACQKIMGKSPHQAISESRLTRAKDLMINTDWKLDAIAKAAGFSTQRYFITCFRDAVGKTPHQWRKAMKSS